MHVQLYNPKNNNIKSIKWGVSWTYLIFGGWALLFSGKWILIGVELVLNMLIAAAGVGAPLTGIYHVYLFFFGNKTYARHLLSKGWRPSNDESARILGVPR